jgi:hydrogenase large subunit
MSFGMFPAPVTGKRAFGAGLIVGRGAVGDLDSNKIDEEIKYSWYRDDLNSRHPEEGTTNPDVNKPNAYTWVKAPRNQGLPVESGPLARGWINGDYRRGVSVMDRLVARVREVLKICILAEDWLAQLAPGAPAVMPYSPPQQGTGVGLTDAMRGALGHWFSYQNGKVAHYQIVTPTTWNFSPRDARGVRGPAEEALIGAPVADADSLIEVGRIVRSFDPCFTCAVHVLNAPKAKPIMV